VLVGDGIDVYDAETCNAVEVVAAVALILKLSVSGVL
jgi:hypothetical protein